MIQTDTADDLYTLGRFKGQRMRKRCLLQLPVAIHAPFLERFWCTGTGNPLPSAAPDPLAGHHPLAGHQDLPQYYVEVETIFCGLQMSQMSCIERTLLQTMLKLLKKVVDLQHA